MSQKTSKFIRRLMKRINKYQKSEIYQLWNSLHPNEKFNLKQELKTAERLLRKESI